MKFLLLHYADESAEWSAEETREDRALLAAWLEDTIARGVNLQGSYLQPSQNAATIRARDGELLLTDGPFAETKEQLGGFYLIEARDLNEALQIASRIPSVKTGTIEVRPVVDFSTQQQPPRAGRQTAGTTT
jgi:hypothetical protein